jgi:hypothetical protein
MGQQFDEARRPRRHRPAAGSGEREQARTRHKGEHVEAEVRWLGKYCRAEVVGLHPGGKGVVIWAPNALVEEKNSTIMHD